jgi:hypothetical protein
LNTKGEFLRRVKYLDHYLAMKSAFYQGKTIIEGNVKIAYDGVDIYGCHWFKNPLQIQGSRYSFSVVGDNLISIGCAIKTIEEWRDSYIDLMNEHSFSEIEKYEYVSYFNLASDLYGHGIALPLPNIKNNT